MILYWSGAAHTALMCSCSILIRGRKHSRGEADLSLCHLTMPHHHQHTEPSAPAEFLKYIDAHADKFIDRLAEAVAIPSISGEAPRRGDVIKMTKWMQGQLESYGVETKSVDLGNQKIDGEELPLPPAILGRLGTDKNKKTVLIYGHLDVQPAKIEDGWNTDPFVLDRAEDGRLIGRGATDDKGPVLGWLNVIEAIQKSQLDLPVNLRFCFEAMEESGSEGLDDLIISEAAKGDEGFFDGVNCVCISDNYWLNTRTPVVTYGLRGLTYWKVTVSGPKRDLHSGVFGGMVHEPMTDLVLLLSKLVETNGKICIEPVADMVEAPTQEEREIYEKMDYSISDVDEAVGASIALSDDKATVLMGRMRNPSLSLHGIEGAFDGAGAKTVIPAKVSGKFSIRLVPPQTPEIVDPLVEKYLKEEFDKLGTKNTLTLENLHGGKPWVASYDHWNYAAAIQATKAVYGRDPDLTREGGSIPVTLTFADSLNVNVLLLPMGRGDDGAHSTNEKLDRSNFIEGSKLLGTYLFKLAALTTGGNI